MAGQMLDYIKMTLKDVQGLEREKTIFFMSISPIEVHGPHLPLGTDVFVAEELQRRYQEVLEKEFPQFSLVKLPPLFLGADALPVNGSLSIPAPLVRKVLLSLAKGLARQGFRYLFLSDNHGGPRHQLAVETAARKLWKKHRFYLVNPFGLVFRCMVQHNPEFMEKSGLEPGCCGDDADAHAGTNETSLMLAINAGLVKREYKNIPPSTLSRPSPRLLFFSRLVKVISPRLSEDLQHLANLLAWVKAPKMLPYMGAPAIAAPGAGEAMLQARVEVGLQLFRQALKGEEVKIQPFLCQVPLLLYLPE